MSFEPREFLRHIASEAAYLESASVGVTHDQFFEDATLQRAFVRSLEIIGEATKRIPNDMRAAHPDVEWRAMAGMCDRLIHEYIGVDLDLVWEVVQDRIPALRESIERIIAAG
jgi:uncharacterized protein with HEPN domain